MNVSENRRLDADVEQVFRRYSKPMLLYALSFSIAETEAEDVVQEVFLNFLKTGSFTVLQEEVVKTYLFRSVKNNCLNRLEKKDVLRDWVDIMYEEAVEEQVSALNDQLIAEIRDEIERMPFQTREVIHAIFFRGCKYQEAADQLGVSINTVKTLLKNGMRHLRERFADRLDLFLIFAVSREP